MATKNLSHFEAPLPSAADMKFGIVVSEWNPEVTNALRDGAVRTLRECGCSDENIIVRYVPGTFELPMGARFFAEHTDVDGVIALGCVVKGETPHFDYVCLGATKGISDVPRPAAGARPGRRSVGQQGRRGRGGCCQNGKVAARIRTLCGGEYESPQCELTDIGSRWDR